MVLLVGFDQLWADYFMRREEVSNLQVKLETIRGTLALQTEVQKSNTALKPDFAELQVRAFKAGTFGDAAGQMEAELGGVLRTLYFDKIEFTKPELLPSAKAREILIEARFTAVPQQLPRLEAALERHSKAMRMRDVAIKVSADSANGGPQLEISARFIGVYMPLEVAPPARPASSASR